LPAARLIGKAQKAHAMIRKLRSGEYRLYSRKVDPKTGKRRNLGTFKSRAAAEKHERAVQYFKRH
jgi:cell division septation protein DedD